MRHRFNFIYKVYDDFAKRNQIFDRNTFFALILRNKLASAVLAQLFNLFCILMWANDSADCCGLKVVLDISLFRCFSCTIYFLQFLNNFLFTSIFFSLHLYGTLGDVSMASTLNSSSRRCRKTSICSIPKKPHLKPLPSVALLSRTKLTAGSVSTNF